MSRRYSQLNLADRRRLFHFVERKLPIKEMARQLGRHRSTIYREIRRHTCLFPCWLEEPIMPSHRCQNLPDNGVQTQHGNSAGSNPSNTLEHCRGVLKPLATGDSEITETTPDVGIPSIREVPSMLDPV
ncbi:Helix-turn-helix domain-containing protein [Sinorhizobium sp. NFACC03]|nr:Helix-turn-helix domain-containing protein [Sinorhizobium sp. NFACC03]